MNESNIFKLDIKELTLIRKIENCYSSRGCIYLYSDNQDNKWVLKIDKSNLNRFWTETYLGTIYYYFSKKYFPKTAFVFDNDKYIGNASMFNDTFTDIGNYHTGDFSGNTIKEKGHDLLHNSGLGIIVILMFLFGEYDVIALFSESSNIGFVENEKGEYIYFKIDNEKTVLDKSYEIFYEYSLCKLDRFLKDPLSKSFIPLYELKSVPRDLEVGSTFKTLSPLFTPDYYHELKDAINYLKEFNLQDFKTFLNDMKNVYDPISGMNNEEAENYKRVMFNCKTNQMLTMDRDSIDAVLFNTFYKIHQLEP